MGRNYLKGRDGDRINAVLAAAGYNFGLLLRWLERLLCALLRALLVGLLKWLDEPVQQNPVKTPIAKANAEPVMFVEGVHGRLPLIRGEQSPPSYHLERAQ